MSNTTQPLGKIDKILYKMLDIIMVIITSLGLIISFKADDISLAIFFLIMIPLYICSRVINSNKPIKTTLKEFKPRHLWDLFTWFMFIVFWLAGSFAAGILVGIVLYAIGWTVRALLKPWWGV